MSPINRVMTVIDERTVYSNAADRGIAERAFVAFVYLL